MVTIFAQKDVLILQSAANCRQADPSPENPPLRTEDIAVGGQGSLSALPEPFPRGGFLSRRALIG
jgi:hypothetical protein